MRFSATFCDPLSPEIIQLGEFRPEQVIAEFEKIDWGAYLQKMKNVKEDDLYYSPSFGIQNKEINHGLEISAVGDPGNYEFYIFYKRPKNRKIFFGLMQKLDENYISQVTGQKKQDAIDCLNALRRNDTDYLERVFGK